MDSHAPETPVERPSRKTALRGVNGQGLILSLLLAIATIAVYRPVDHYPFIHTDDPSYVTENPHVQSGLSRATVKWALTTHDAANWHPLTWLSHSLDCQLFGLNAARHHEMNVILHAVNAILLFWILLQATGFTGRSFMVAALFALHPINVESVAWISERKTLLSMFFFLLALAAYGWYARKPRARPYAAVMGLYALALIAKPQAITFPCVLLLWDYWPLRRVLVPAWVADEGGASIAGMPQRTWSWLLAEKLPLLALSIISAKLTISAQFGSYAETWFPKSVRVENAIVSYARYLGKCVWPVNLAFLYPHSMSLYPLTEIVPALLLLAGISGFAVYRRRQRYLLVGWLWFLGTLVPMIGLIQVGKQAMADRYAYLSFIGLFIMLCWSGAELAVRVRVPRGLQMAVCVALLLGLGALTNRQTRYWSSDETLWTHTLQATSGNWAAEDALGTELWRLGRSSEAVSHFANVVEVVPYDYTANVDLGTYQAMHGNPAGAVELLKRAAGLDNLLPRDRANALNNLGQAYLQLKDYEQARQSFSFAIKVSPGDYGAWIGLGIALQKEKKPDLAAKAYSHAVKMRPVDWVYLLLAQALEDSGHSDQAHAVVENVRLTSPNPGLATRTADQILTP